MNCGYKYVADAGTISGQSVAGNKLSVTGLKLDTVATPITASVGGVKCSVAPVVTATTLKCDLTSAPPAGSWNVKVNNIHGDVPVSGTKIDVAVTVTSLTPNTNMN
jgi:hypothetical protein